MTLAQNPARKIRITMVEDGGGVGGRDDGPEPDCYDGCAINTITFTLADILSCLFSGSAVFDISLPGTVKGRGGTEILTEGRREPAGKRSPADGFIADVLRRLGILNSCKGSQFIRHAITLCIEDEMHLFGVTKTLYPAIAKKYETTPGHVERSIRYALGRAWKAGEAEHSLADMGLALPNRRSRPSNSIFLRAVFDRYSEYIKDQ